MLDNEAESLHSFLSKDGRGLENFKFVPGTSRGLTTGEMLAEADRVVRNAFSRNLPDEPPHSGNKKVVF